MIYSVTDFESTALVSRNEDAFVVTHLSTGKEVRMDFSDFYGVCFKYEGEFLRKFASVFKDEEINNIILSFEASTQMTNLLYFNRVDS